MTFGSGGAASTTEIVTGEAAFAGAASADTPSVLSTDAAIAIALVAVVNFAFFIFIISSDLSLFFVISI
jgi:hypothetical protein